MKSSKLEEEIRRNEKLQQTETLAREMGKQALTPHADPSSDEFTCHAADALSHYLDRRDQQHRPLSHVDAEIEAPHLSIESMQYGLPFAFAEMLRSRMAA